MALPPAPEQFWADTRSETASVSPCPEAACEDPEEDVPDEEREDEDEDEEEEVEEGEEDDEEL